VITLTGDFTYLETAVARTTDTFSSTNRTTDTALDTTTTFQTTTLFEVGIAIDIGTIVQTGRETSTKFETTFDTMFFTSTVFALTDQGNNATTFVTSRVTEKETTRATETAINNGPVLITTVDTDTFFITEILTDVGTEP